MSEFEEFIGSGLPMRNLAVWVGGMIGYVLKNNHSFPIGKYGTVFLVNKDYSGKFYLFQKEEIKCEKVSMQKMRGGC